MRFRTELRIRVRLLAALLAMAFVNTGTHATELVRTPRIVDGDTLAIGTTKIRLQGIDAAETDQVCLNAQGERWSCGIEARLAASPLTSTSTDENWLAAALLART